MQNMPMCFPSAHQFTPLNQIKSSNHNILPWNGNYDAGRTKPSPTEKAIKLFREILVIIDTAQAAQAALAAAAKAGNKPQETGSRLNRTTSTHLS